MPLTGELHEECLVASPLISELFERSAMQMHISVFVGDRAELTHSIGDE